VLILLAAVLVGAAVLVLGTGPGRVRRVESGAGPPMITRTTPAAAAVPAAGGSWPGWTRRAASVVAGLAVWMLVGGVPGAVLGAGLAVLGPPALGRLESGAQRRKRLALVAAAPLVADLLAASLAAGATLDRSLPVIARAMGEPAQAELEQVAAHVRLGEPADLAWSRLARSPGLGAIAVTVARSSRSGAPLAAMLAATAEDLRAEAAAASLAEVRAASVRAVLPLGLCLLPAFVLLGILPVVAGLVPSL